MLKPFFQREVLVALYGVLYMSLDQCGRDLLLLDRRPRTFEAMGVTLDSRFLRRYHLKSLYIVQLEVLSPAVSASL